MTYYRLNADFVATGRDEPIHAGTLLFQWRASRSGIMPQDVGVSERPDGWGKYVAIPRELLDVAPAPKAGEFEALLRFFMCGYDVPPNLEMGTDESLQSDLSALAHRGCLGSTMIGGRIMLPGMGVHHGEMAFALCGHTQGGALTGEAHVLIYRPTWGGNRNLARTAKFMMCDHKFVMGAGARPERGWRPGHCSKCGLDMSVDSGD